MRINEMGLLGPEIPGLRALMWIATEPQTIAHDSAAPAVIGTSSAWAVSL
jgi:hypothetical protein